MTQTHEQLKKNVDVSRTRLDTTRAKRLDAERLHNRHRILNPILWVTTPFSFLVILMAWPVWAVGIYTVVMIGVAIMAWKDLRSAKKSIERYAEDARNALSDLCDDIQRLDEREALQLMDPSAYTAIEDEEMARRKDLERKYLTRRDSAIRYEYIGPSMWALQDEDGDWEVIRSW
jgi:hypothetical protein